jgi:3-mercaptopyruvate sulfurtransferase SseA
MRLKLIYFAAIFVAAFIVDSCNGIDQTVKSSPPPSKTAIGPETTYADGARRITTAELESLMKDGKVFVVDVRNQASYDQGHIPGSRLIPAGEIANHLDELPRDKMIVTYCS